MAKRLGVWVVTMDFAHGENQDLLDRDLQQLLFALAEAEVFLGLGAAPECCSFSRAVCPAVRSSSSPEGLPHLTKNMKVQVDRGNQHAVFLLRLVLIFIMKDLPYWIENPDGSFLWLLKDWLEENVGTPAESYRFDMCRDSTPWRKRTRIATSTELKGHRHLCAGGHSHQILRGRNAAAKMCWTKMAQVYPKALARDLAAAMGKAAGLSHFRLKLSIAGCATCGHLQIGEAGNPGPRTAQRVPRDPRELEEVLLVEPVTQALQRKVWFDFEKLLFLQFSSSTEEQMYLCPLLVVEVIEAYGVHLFGAGHRLYEFRHLIVFAQQKYPWIKQHMTSAWQLATK